MTSDLLSLFKVTRLLISSRQRWARERGLPGEQGQRSDDRKQEVAEAMQRREGCRPLVETLCVYLDFALRRSERQGRWCNNTEQHVTLL